MSRKRPIPDEDNTTQQPQLERLQKVLAAAGLASRRKCEEYILAGRVTVDDEVVEDLGVRVDPHRQEVCVDHVPLRAQRKVYFMLNKPRGVLCTNQDPGGRPRVIDLFPGHDARLFPVGRLDENSEGLILVTNDGELGNRLAHPRYGIPRTYRVQVAGSPTRHTLDQLREGLYFSEGKFRVESVKRVSSRGKSTTLELVLNEGKNREIRRLLARVGHKVQRLRRIGFGPLRLGKLETARYRLLLPDEVKALRDWAAGQRPATKTPADFRRKKQSKGKPAEEQENQTRQPRRRATARPAVKEERTPATKKRMSRTSETRPEGTTRKAGGRSAQSGTKSSNKSGARSNDRSSARTSTKAAKTRSTGVKKVDRGRAGGRKKATKRKRTS